MPSTKIEWSPFEENRLTVSSSQTFGFAGAGKQTVLDVTPGGLKEVCSWYTSDALYDCAWSEENENYLAGSSGDGSVKLWDMRHKDRPIRAWKEHASEVHSIDWNIHKKNLFATGSWDDSLKLWSPESEVSLRTWTEHRNSIYCVRWSPHEADILATVGGDYLLKLWDTRQTTSGITVEAHHNEIISCDWNKYNPQLFATGSVDKTIKIWDIRNTQRPLRTLFGHKFAVRDLRWSPHHKTQLLSASYDMSSVVWDIDKDEPLIERFENHTEFVLGVSYNIFLEGVVASCGWDCKVSAWKLGQKPE